MEKEIILTILIFKLESEIRYGSPMARYRAWELLKKIKKWRNKNGK